MLDNIKSTFGGYSKIVSIIGIILILDVILPLLFNIIGIPISYFMVYLIWFNVMLILYFILPNRVGTMFL